MTSVAPLAGRMTSFVSLSDDMLSGMPTPRYEDSLVRMLVSLTPGLASTDPSELARRFAVLYRTLEPEDEFSLLLSWLGKCELVHKLSQEQLPLGSTDEYRVPDLLAIFSHEGKSIPVLIEVKKTERPTLKNLKPGYLTYASALGLPMLIAWKHHTLWTLFEMRHASRAEVNYKIDISRAMTENMLMLLAGDFSYKVVPGTAIRMRLKKLSEPGTDGSFTGEVTEAYFTNAAGTRIPDIPQLWHLLSLWQDEVEIVDEGSSVLQSFVIQETGSAEFASRTFTKMQQALTSLRGEEVDWRAVTHDLDHWAHKESQFRDLVARAATHGVLTDVHRCGPKHPPAFL